MATEEIAELQNAKGVTIKAWINALWVEAQKADLTEFYKTSELKEKDWSFDWQIARDPREALIRDVEFQMIKIRLTCPIFKTKIKE
jgi:hypothetical protein